jgi:hypothetical protein
MCFSLYFYCCVVWALDLVFLLLCCFILLWRLSFLAPLQLLSIDACSVVVLFAMAPSRTLCFPTVSSLYSRFCSLDGPGHVIDPFSTILYHFLVARSLDCLHAFVGVAHLTCVPLMLYFPIFLLPILIRGKKKKIHPQCCK